MEDSFTYVNKLYEEAKLKQIKDEVLGDVRSELRTIWENHFFFLFCFYIKHLYTHVNIKFTFTSQISTDISGIKKNS